MKYVIMEDLDGISYPFIFRKLFTHADMQYLARSQGYKIVSGGFVCIDPDGDYKCFGRSESLNLDSRPEDSDIINMSR